MQKAAIKKMDMQASNEFLAELKVLTNVHHLNLVLLSILDPLLYLLRKLILLVNYVFLIKRETLG